MQGMKKFLLAVLIAAAVGCNSAENKQPVETPGDAEPADGTIPKAVECPGDIICTAMFASVSVQIKDAAGKPVMLDSFTSVRVKDQANMFPEKANILQMPAEGSYPVADDNNINILSKSGDEIVFTAYMNGKAVAKENYVVGHDCCHVELKRGKRDITIN